VDVGAKAVNRAAAARPLLCVVHLPKTGGASLQATLISMLGRQRVYWMVVANAQQWRHIEDLDCRRFAAVGGHHSVALFDKIARPKVYMAVIRDPIQRAISLFHYIVEGSPRPHPLRPELRGLTVPQALARSAQFRHLVTDAQCLMIGGARHYDAALQSLCERVWFVDTTQNIDPLFTRVCRKFGWPNRALLRENAAPSGYAEAYACEATIDALQQLNMNDSRLYRMFADCGDRTRQTPQVAAAHATAAGADPAGRVLDLAGC
jgi:hypothetical protein